MIPVECDLTRRPMSERIVFDAIKKNLSDEWHVFHSFDYVTRDLNRKRWDGEIDFLLYHPQKGMLVIEVKGGAISYRNGQWYQEDRPGGRGCPYPAWREPQTSGAGTGTIGHEGTDPASGYRHLGRTLSGTHVYRCESRCRAVPYREAYRENRRNGDRLFHLHEIQRL